MMPVSRRSLLHLTGAALGGLGPVFPSHAVEADAGLGAPLRVWTTETWPERITVIRYLLDVFSAASDQPQVVFESFSEAAILDAVRAATRVGSRTPMPHIINTGVDALMAMDAEGVLSDDGDRMVRTLGLETFEPGALAAVRQPDGRLAAVPFHGWPQAVWCRQDWLQNEHDLPPPQSLDDLLTAARALFDPDRKRRGVILGTTGDFYTQQCFMMIARAVGASVFSVSHGVAIDQPEMAEALEVYAGLARYTGPGRLTWRARDYYLQHRAGLLFYSTFLMDDLVVESLAADSLGRDYYPDLDGARFDSSLVDHTVPVLLLTGAKPGAVGAYTAINGLGLTGVGTLAERLAARRLVQFLFRRDAYISWLHMAPGGMIPVVRGVLTDDAFMRDRLGVFKTFGRSVTRRLGRALAVPSAFSMVAGSDPPCADPRAGQVYASGVLGRMVMRYLDGDQSARQVVAEAREEAERWLE